MTPNAHMKRIRPKVVFGAVERRFPATNVAFKVNIPSPEIGGLTLLESSVLVSLLKLSGATSLFEFGTYRGATSILLAENSHAEARLVTVDIPHGQVEMPANAAKPDAVLSDGDANDQYLREEFLRRGAACIRRADESVRNKIDCLLIDSRQIDSAARGWTRAFDYIFIDGGHDVDTVRSDTLNADRMLKSDGIIIWHDFESKIHDGVTMFLREEHRERDLYHVEHTMLVFELRGAFRDILLP